MICTIPTGAESFPVSPIDTISEVGVGAEVLAENKAALHGLFMQLGSRVFPLTQESSPAEYEYWTRFPSVGRRGEQSGRLVEDVPYIVSDRADIGVVAMGTRHRPGASTVDEVLYASLAEHSLPVLPGSTIGRATVQTTTHEQGQEQKALNLMYMFQNTGLVHVTGFVRRVADEATYTHAANIWQELGLDRDATLPHHDEGLDTVVLMHNVGPGRVRDLGAYLVEAVQ